eukprot:scaffold13090_cov122-Isochrysis_galbana.AAC.3
MRDSVGALEQQQHIVRAGALWTAAQHPCGVRRRRPIQFGQDCAAQLVDGLVDRTAHHVEGGWKRRSRRVGPLARIVRHPNI